MPTRADAASHFQRSGTQPTSPSSPTGARGHARALAAALLVLATTLFSAPAVTAEPQRALRPFPTVALPERTRGEHAIKQLGARLPEVAQWYGMTTSQFARTLLADRTAWLDREGRLLFIDEIDSNAGAVAATPTTSAAAPFPLEQTFLLHSRPGAKRTLYINFVGATVTGTAWNNGFGLAAIQAAAFDLDGNVSDFSAAERSAIQAVWQRVAEDYAPFDVDVTTEMPAAERITRSSSTDDVFGAAVMVTRDWTVAAGSPCGCGGFAYVGVFDFTTDVNKPGWVFFDNLASYEKYVAEAVSHEAGHMLGLSHDGYNNGTTQRGYYGGHGSGTTSWAPIMGNSYHASVTQWSKGEYPYATQTEDDLAVMQTYGAPLRADDHGNDIAHATSLSWSKASGVVTLSGSGVVGARADVDLFGFYSSGGAVALQVDPFALGANLDIQATLHDALGNVVASASPPSALNASINLDSIPAGNYYLKVEGVGFGDAATGYTDYASLGHYSISGTLTGSVTPNQPPVAMASASGTSGNAPLTVNLSSAGSSDPEGGALTYDWDFGDGTAHSTAANPTHVYNAVGSYTTTLTVRDPQGAATNASLTIVVSAPPPTTVMHVGAIDMELGTNKRGVRGLATVRVVDAKGMPVSGATVTGQWTGTMPGTATGTTGTDGSIRLGSPRTRATGPLTFTFTITGVSKSGATYNAAANVETSDSISR